MIVAVAGNAVENFVAVKLAADNRMEYALSVVLNSALQIALAITPILVLLSFVLGGPVLTLVLPPLLVAAVLLGTCLPRPANGARIRDHRDRRRVHVARGRGADRLVRHRRR